MELGNQVSCKIRGGWGGGQRDNPREEALRRPQHVCVKKVQNTLVPPAWRPSAGHTGWQGCREGLLAFLLVDF